METKLTLRVDTRLIDAAKLYARKQGVSLSKLVADYFQLITSTKNKRVETFQLTPILAEIAGVLHKKSANKNFRDDYHKHLEEKYLGEPSSSTSISFWTFS